MWIGLDDFYPRGDRLLSYLGLARAKSEAELAVFVSTGEPVTVSAEEDATILVMAGEGIHEPVIRYGPFVMNTKAELIQAVNDYQAGKMGHLS